MIVWQGNSKEGSDYNSIKPVNIKFVYVSPHLDKPDIPRVRFTLVDSSITSTDYNNLDVHGIYYQLSVPPSFDLISFHYKRRGFSSTPVSYSYDSEHEVYCENYSSINQLIFEFYNRGSLERKYEFNTEGVGEAIRQIACN